MRMPISQYLRDCGYKVIEAVNAGKAMSLLHQETPVDVVFSDIEMPGSIDGFGLAKWIRENRRRRRVLGAFHVLLIPPKSYASKGRYQSHMMRKSHIIKFDGYWRQGK